MSSDSRYYWVKLDYSRFESGGDLDFLMGQPNGSEYVALYLMLCLNTRNTDGELISKLGEVIIPYDVDKIKRDCKYFSRDTIVIALSLFKQLGLIFEQENGILKINSFDSMVGSTSTSAARVKRMRGRQKALAIESECNTVQQDNTEALQCNAKCNENVTTDIRDKSLDIREKNKEVIEDSLEDNKLSSHSSSFVPPLSEEKGETPAESQKIFINFPLLGGKSVDITEAWCDEQQRLFGNAVNIRDEIKLAIAWCHANHYKQKWKAFLNNWFNTCLKRGGSITPYIPEEESTPITPYISEESKEEKEARLEEVRKATRAIRERARLQEEERQKELRESAK